MSTGELSRTHSSREPVPSSVRHFSTHRDEGEENHIAERLKQSFVQTLVRDVRVPMSGVLGLLKSFETKLLAREPFDVEDRQRLCAAIEHSTRVCHLVDDHLEVTQSDDLPLSLELRSASLAHLLETAIEPLRAEAALRGVAIELRIAADAPNVLADVREMNRALGHILGAALVATRDGGRIGVEAHGIDGQQAEGCGRNLAFIHITEDSTEIIADEAPFLFDAFHELSIVAHTDAASRVGLALAQRIVIAHDGQLSAINQPGDGMTYSLTLPAAT